MSIIEHTIRAARSADLIEMLALYHHLHPEDPALTPAEAEPAWSALFSCGLTTPIVAEVAGVLASTCTLAIVPNLSRGGRPYGVIENVVTHPDHRRIGLGRSVLEAALAMAWKGRCYKVLLATGSKQKSTLRFYEGAGFRSGEKTYFEVRRP